MKGTFLAPETVTSARSVKKGFIASTEAFWLAKKPAMETAGSTVDPSVETECVQIPESERVLQLLPVESKSSDPVESTLVLVESSKGRR